MLIYRLCLLVNSRKPGTWVSARCSIPNSRLGVSCEIEKPLVVEGGKEVVLFMRLHQSHDSVTVFQRELFAFSRGDKNPTMLDQDRSFSLPLGKMMTSGSCTVCLCAVHLGHTAHPTQCCCWAPLHKWCCTREEHKGKTTLKICKIY